MRFRRSSPCARAVCAPERTRQRIVLHRELADLGVQLGDVGCLLLVALGAPNTAGAPSRSWRFHLVITLGWTSKRLAISMIGCSPLIASRATLALKAGEWLRRGRRGTVGAPPRSAAAEQYHLSGCPISPGHFPRRRSSRSRRRSSRAKSSDQGKDMAHACTLRRARAVAGSLRLQRDHPCGTSS